MKKSNNILLLILIATLSLVLVLFVRTDKNQKENFSQKSYSTSSAKSGIEQKKGRTEYFYHMLKDPATNEIPRGIREKELVFAKKLQQKSTRNLTSLNWTEAGPNDVGGRTRALAVDVTNPNTIIAGGASGGIWKSTDKGNSWQMKSTASQVLSVTSLAQDTRSGRTNTWYYASGEFRGSAQDLGFTAFFTGAGIYKSTDNGETWSLLPNAKDDDPTSWSTPFDYVSKIIVNPTTGSVFIASHAFGIMRSTDGGNSFALVLGGANEHINSDIDIASDGTIVAVISSPFQGVTSTNQPGIYKSSNDGVNWTNITANSFPSTHLRSVVEIAPSNTNVAYVFTFTGSFLNDDREDVRFHKINISNGSADDRSSNMPDFNVGLEDFINTQQSYNMVVSIKPDDENFVMIGATSLFRSTNGFSSKPSSQKLDWIGGYHPDSFMYPNLHADIHSFAFDPTNPNALWWGHDGGLSYTSDIRTTNYQTYFPWENKNNSYNVTQFYTITIPNEAGDNRIMGGTQDNATPSFRFDGTNTTASVDVSSGDGSYCYFGDNFAYSSAQNGRVIRLHYDGQNNIIPPFSGDPNKTYKDITPIGAENQLFINPFAVDPNNEEIMYYLSGNVLWRNIQLSTPADDWNRGTSIGWSKLDNLSVPTGYVLSTLAISHNNPTHRLYYAASDFNQNPGSPKIYRLDNANNATSGAVDISISNAANGAYVHSIAVNPNDADELIIVFSNYNITGIYHSTNAGASFNAVEGNLEGTQANPGPSIRSATILPSGGTTKYIIATSTGVYSTSTFNGGSTVWELEGPNTIGNVVVDYITSRHSDGRIVAGTHGRGAFVSESSGSSAPKPATDVSTLTLRARPGETGSTSFTLSNDGGSALNYNITVSGDLILANNISSNFILKKVTPGKNISELTKTIDIKTKKIPRYAPVNSSATDRNTQSAQGSDVLVLDDGDEGADYVFGFGDGVTDFNWFNEFNLTGFDFQLDEIRFYMRTENAFSNYLFIGLYDQNSNLLAEVQDDFPLSADGSWYSVSVDSPISFNDGETFFIQIGTYFSFISYPAGLDVDAQVPNKSFYFDGTNWVNLNTVSGAENGSFLIRAVGTAGVGTNQDPVAIANVNPTQAEINQLITFDGTGSYDNDGQITQYFWNFGDGTTSTQQTVQHAYSQANTYNYSLTVTDNEGATNQVSGQVIVGAGTNQPPVAVANVNPTETTVNEMISFNGSGSYDNDGQITQYLWDFGDGATSAQQIVQHSYSQVNTYNYSLTVTDDKGATNQTAGEVRVIEPGNSFVTVSPASGSINSGGSQLITLTLDASEVTEGTYVGQLNIYTNGGNVIIPIDYVVDVEEKIELPTEYSLSQNYPNPFNPSTTIEFTVPKPEKVALNVYDMLGRKVAELVNKKVTAGKHKVEYNVTGLSSGVYIYRLKTRSYTNTRKLVFIK